MRDDDTEDIRGLLIKNRTRRDFGRLKLKTRKSWGEDQGLPARRMKKPAERALSSDCGSLVFLDDRVQVVQRFLHGQGVHFTSAIFAGLNSPFQIMSCNLDRHGIGDDPSGLPIELHPCHVGKRDPHRPVANQELDINGISVPGRNRNNQGLVLAVQRLGRSIGQLPGSRRT